MPKPKKIIIDDLTLKPISITPKLAQKIFDIFHEDKSSFKFWMNGNNWKTATEVLNKYKTKYIDTEYWKFAMYGIFRGNELLGEIGLYGIDVKNQTAEIGYWLKPSARALGLIDKLIPVIEKLGFETLNLRKINIWCDTDNIASRRHAEKNNYVLEGVIRERKLWPDGSVHSTAMFGKLKSEYKK